MVAEFQANNKMVGKKVMAHAERAKELATDQYGSRKNHKSIDCCVNKRITGDISRQRRAPTMIMSNDARGCYDRIHHILVNQKEDRQSRGNDRLLLWKYKIVVDTEG